MTQLHIINKQTSRSSVLTIFIIIVIIIVIITLGIKLYIFLNKIPLVTTTPSKTMTTKKQPNSLSKNNNTIVPMIMDQQAITDQTTETTTITPSSPNVKNATSTTQHPSTTFIPKTLISTITPTSTFIPKTLISTITPISTFIPQTLISTITPTINTMSPLSQLSPLLWFKFNIGDLSGCSLKNYGSLSSDGIVINSSSLNTLTFQTGDASFPFDGNSYIIVPSLPFSNNGFSIVCWVNYTSVGWSRLFDFGNGQASDNVVYGPYNGIDIYVGATNKYYFTNQTTGAIADASWHHIVITMTYATSGSTTSVLVVYVDGKQNFKATNATYPQNIFRSNCYLGKSNWGEDPMAVGYIDDFRFYNYVLTSDQITSSYNYDLVSTKNMIFNGKTGGMSITTFSSYTITPTFSSASWLNPQNMSGIYSVRLINLIYYGPVICIRRDSDGEFQDFYTDTTQSYLTTGANNTGMSFSKWVGTSTAYVCVWYDQSGNNLHATNVANDNTQPILVPYSCKWVLQFDRSQQTALNLLGGVLPNTVCCHFYNSNNNHTTILNTNLTTYSGIRLVNTTNVSSDVNDWYYASSGTKTCYNNGVSTTTVLFNAWNVLSMSVSTPNWADDTASFNLIGKSRYSDDRSMTGYMVEMLMYNTIFTGTDMTTYYKNCLF